MSGWWFKDHLLIFNWHDCFNYYKFYEIKNEIEFPKLAASKLNATLENVQSAKVRNSEAFFLEQSRSRANGEIKMVIMDD